MVAAPTHVAHEASHGSHCPSANCDASHAIAGVDMRFPGWPVSTKLLEGYDSRRMCACVYELPFVSSSALYHVWRVTLTAKVMMISAFGSHGLTPTCATNVSAVEAAAISCHANVGHCVLSGGYSK